MSWTLRILSTELRAGTPADVLSMDPEDLGICLVCMCAADHSRRDMVKQVQRQSGKSMIPFPVPTIDLGDL